MMTRVEAKANLLPLETIMKNKKALETKGYTLRRRTPDDLGEHTAHGVRWMRNDWIITTHDPEDGTEFVVAGTGLHSGGGWSKSEVARDFQIQATQLIHDLIAAEKAGQRLEHRLYDEPVAW